MVKIPVMLYKSLVVGVILLFIGVGIQPAIANNLSNSDDDCDICQPISKEHLVILKSLTKQLETYTNRLMLESKHYLEFEDKYQELSNKILILKQLSQEIKLNSIFKNNVLICSFLFIIGFIAAFFWISNYQIIDVVSFIIDIEKHPFMAIFFYFNYYFWGLLMLKAASLMVDLECFGQIPSPWFQSFIPLKSICTLSETKDITNLIEDCPCLQE